MSDGEHGPDGAREAIDAANATDPRSHDGTPLALAQGRMAEEWSVRLGVRGRRVRAMPENDGHS